MKLSEQFEQKLNAAYSALAVDEWAVANLRDEICSGASPAVAFENVVDVLRISERNPDALLDCCWMALALARQSQTAEIPAGLPQTLESLYELAKAQSVLSEVEAIYAWYRIQPNCSFNPDALKRAG
jgi:hypothetical protein